ncbi:type II toxin-antitoxin system VapC family toxin [Microbacterium hominis]|uniref:Ribonuclease VapC n=1 Tax=Microbacterium hominis TaxID=162426 RepID=A0A7D4PX63_9MICO|nr:type II toxin-antitoxin system VapC family toxin [Microbacterium hominis]QKJ20774.1 type II toxin-antitoxin system VapC family toxin [Microbacterium hominis]
MIVDTSALIAILQDEDSAADLAELLLEQGGAISAVTLLEARIVALARGGASAVRRVDDMVAQFSLDIAPFDARQSDVAATAYRDYGKGSGHPARLNFGDTASYALARVQNDSLLYVGDDFSRTDIRPALEDG